MKLETDHNVKIFKHFVNADEVNYKVKHITLTLSLSSAWMVETHFTSLRNKDDKHQCLESLWEWTVTFKCEGVGGKKKFRNKNCTLVNRPHVDVKVCKPSFSGNYNKIFDH